MTEVLIDNATIHSAANIFRRIQSKMNVREINIVGLDNIIEAYILNDCVNISEEYWDYWLENTPQEWHEYYFNVFFKSKPINIDFTKFKTFASSDIVFFILNNFINHIKHKTTIEYDFLTYTGQDFGNYNISMDDLFKVDKILEEKWDWTYHHANKDHIDTVMMAYRTIEYIHAAEKEEYNFLPHSVRNEFINEIGYAYGFNIFRDYNKKAYDNFYKKIVGNIANPIAKSIKSLRENSEIIWSRVPFPLLSSLVYENSTTAKDIFKQASKLRQKMSPFRNKINDIKGLVKDKQFKNADKEINQLVTYSDKLSIGTGKTRNELTFQFGFPFNFVLGITPKIETPKYLRIFTDLNHRFHLPDSYIHSCIKLFHSIRWNKELSDNSAILKDW